MRSHPIEQRGEAALAEEIVNVLGSMALRLNSDPDLTLRQLFLHSPLDHRT